MKSKLVKFSFKSMLLPALILGGILVVAAFLIGVTVGVTDQFYKVTSGGILSYTYSVQTANSGLTILVGFTLSAAYIMGLTIFSYRQSLKKADLFYQIPYEEKSLRNSRILAGLLYIAIIFTVSFLILIAVYGFRLALTPEVKENATYIFIKAVIYPERYLLGFIVGLTTTCATYLITCFFASTSSSLENSIAVSLEGFLLLAFSTFVLFFGLWELEYERSSYTIEGGWLDNITHNFGLSPYQIGGFINRVVNWQAVGADITLYEGELETLVIDVILYVILGGLTLIPLLVMKEPSAETCGKGFGRKPAERIIHHITFGFICFAAYLVVSSSSFGIYMIFYLIIVSVYFLSTAGLNRSFKMKLNDILPMVINASATTISSLIYLVYYNGI